MASHTVKGFRNGRRAAIGEPRDDCATGEDFRIGSKHGCGHGATGREAGDEDSFPVKPMRLDHRLDRLSYRKRLAGIPLHIGRLEPVEAEIWIVGSLLFGIEQCEAGIIGKLRPA